MHVMSFWFGPNLGDFMFKGFTINGVLPITVLCIFLGIFAIFYESMKVHDAKMRARAARERQRTASCAPSETATLLTVDMSSVPKQPFTKRLVKGLTDASIFLVHNILGYGLMLSVMMYNGYLFIAVIIGFGLGYFIFGHISMKINMENVQAKTTNVICSPRCGDAGSSPTPSSSTSSQGLSYTINTTPSATIERLREDISPIREASRL